MRKIMVACLIVVVAASLGAQDFEEDEDAVLAEARRKYLELVGASTASGDVNIDIQVQGDVNIVDNTGGTFIVNKGGNAVVDSQVGSAVVQDPIVNENAAGGSLAQNVQDAKASPAPSDAFDRAWEGEWEDDDRDAGSSRLGDELRELGKELKKEIDSLKKSVKPEAEKKKPPFALFDFQPVPGLSFSGAPPDTLLALGPIGTVVNSVSGVQAAGIFNVSNESVLGYQGAGVFNVAGGSLAGGAQMAGIFNVSGDNSSFGQLAGIFNRTGNGFKGIQGAGIFNISGDLLGAQLSGIFNIAGDVVGIQAAGIFNSAKKVTGLQIGLINVCDEIYGLPIGLINIIRNGISETGIMYDETGRGYAYVQRGSSNWYSLVYAGANIASAEAANWDFVAPWAQDIYAAAGLGSRLGMGNLWLDTDTSIKMNVGRYLNSGLPTVAEIGAGAVPAFLSSRVALGMKLFGIFKLSGGFMLDWDFPGFLPIDAAMKSEKAEALTLFDATFYCHPKFYVGLAL